MPKRSPTGDRVLHQNSHSSRTLANNKSVVISLEKLDCSLSDFAHFFMDQSPSAFLDSCNRDRFSILAFSPFAVIQAKNGSGTLKIKDQERPLKEPLEDLLRYYESFPKRTSPFPVSGGAIGYFSYDLNRYFEKIPSQTVDELSMPDFYFGFYDLFLYQDHQTSKIYLVSTGDSPRTDSELNSYCELISEKMSSRPEKIPSRSKEMLSESEEVSSQSPTALSSRGQRPRDLGPNKLTSSFSKATYIDAVLNIKDLIRQGEIYQANLSQRFQIPYAASSWDLYKKLRQKQPSEFSAYLDCGPWKILSHSPERFIHVDASGKIITQPIKGTCLRGRTPESDQNAAQRLLHSDKDKAELLMIVDLERNDLGRICETGSVQTLELFGLKSLTHIHHMQATIQGKLRADASVMDILRATFPGGSITGAPKIRAMEILEEIEPYRRGVYTGSIGYLSFSGEIDLNIAIRTAIHCQDKLYFQVGGGIVWDSDPEEEYLETLNKGKFFMETLSQLNPKTSWETNFSKSL